MEKVRKYKKTNPDSKILEFFRPLIPANDWHALKCSLYLRQAFMRKEPTADLKEDIRFRFGVRGNNIANLCTSGYFEGFLMPLYNASQNRFKELYDVVVQTAFPCVFVSGKKGPYEISSEINSKIEMCKRYGVSYLHINGIGSTNIAKVKNFVEKNKKNLNFLDRTPFEDKERGIIMIELILE